MHYCKCGQLKLQISLNEVAVQWSDLIHSNIKNAPSWCLKERQTSSHQPSGFVDDTVLLHTFPVIDDCPVHT